MKDQNISFFICYTGTALSCIFRVVRARECDTCLNQSPPHLTCSHSRRGIFLAMSEKRPLIAGADERVSARGLGLVGVIALVIFALAASSTINLRPKGLLRPASGPSQTLPALDAHDQTTLAPASVTTLECAGDRNIPVLRGVDTVAYFSLKPGAPAVHGSEEHAAEFNGYLFYFSSNENKLIFESDPKQYVPAWGGFCSYGIAHEPIWNPQTLGPPSNPDYWLISPSGHVHIFHSSIPMGKFMLDMEDNLHHGRAVWNSWFGEDADLNGHGPFDTACFCSVHTCKDA